MGMTAPAVCVKPTTMVCTIAVSTEFGSDAEIPGTVQACEIINRTANSKGLEVDFNIFPPFISNSDRNTKPWNHTLIGGTFVS
jgi:hypothetical protein